MAKRELDDQLEAKEDLVASLEESLEEAKYQIKALTERLNEDGEKYQTEVQTLLEMNNEFKTKADQLEQRVQEAHERYVKSKGKGRLVNSKKKQPTSLDRFNESN